MVVKIELRRPRCGNCKGPLITPIWTRAFPWIRSRARERYRTLRMSRYTSRALGWMGQDDTLAPEWRSGAPTTRLSCVPSLQRDVHIPWNLVHDYEAIDFPGFWCTATLALFRTYSCATIYKGCENVDQRLDSNLDPRLTTHHPPSMADVEIDPSTLTPLSPVVISKQV